MLDARLFPASGAEQASILIGCALGVPQGFYAALAAFLSNQGYTVVTFDYRGILGSGQGAPRGREILLEHWGSRDIDAVLAAMKRRAPDGVLLLLGHSAGGQMFGLAENSRMIDALVMVSSPIPHWRSLKSPWNLVVFMFSRLIAPLFCVGRDIFPARRLGFSSVNIPTGVIRQWTRWARLRYYLWDPKSGVDTRRFAQFSFPVLVCFIDDDGYAPWGAVEEVLVRLPATRQQVWTIEGQRAPGGKHGHVNFFREVVGGGFWPELAERLQQLVKRPL
jgi:predicted alpha/beta hydrolase